MRFIVYDEAELDLFLGYINDFFEFIFIERKGGKVIFILKNYEIDNFFIWLNENMICFEYEVSGKFIVEYKELLFKNINLER